MATSNSTASPITIPAKRRGRPTKSVAKQPVLPSCIHRLDDNAKQAIELATKLLEESSVYRTDAISSPESVRTYLKLKLAGLPHEEFHAIWADAQNRVIAFDRLSSGTLTQTSVYPREVVKAALGHNAASVVFAHNHPSGVHDPSRADLSLTSTLKQTLAMIDVKVLDHFIVAGNASPFSFKENGLM